MYTILPFLEETSLHDLGRDGDPDHWTSLQLAGSAKRIVQPLRVMTCPSRRPLTSFAVNWPDTVSFQGGQYAPLGSDPVPHCARGDYAANAGDQIENNFTWEPADLETATAMTKNGNWPQMNPVATGLCFYRSKVKQTSVIDGTSNVYMIGEKYVNPDFYLTGQDGGDNESMYCGYNNDNHRTTYYKRLSGPTHTPMQDRPGVNATTRFGSVHVGGCNMAFADGSVHVVGYDIDPELHRRLGSRNDEQIVDKSSF
jgi:prepilin-type processing-associated H-X9-DG protein